MNNHLTCDLAGNILVVDDLPENLRLMTELLSQRGYRVRSARSGRMALKTLQVKLPDIILLDIKMPDMDGYQVCERLKADEATRQVPVIFVSALDEVFDKVKAFRVGGVDYLTKPLQVEEVVARLENQLVIQRQKRWLQEEIAQRQTTELRLQQSQTLLSSILNSALDGIAALQAVRDELTEEIVDFRCLVANSMLANLLGRTPDELTDQLIWHRHLAALAPDLFEALSQTVFTGKPLEQDFCSVVSGGLHWYQINAVKLADGLALTLRDITSRKQAELALQEANLKLENLAHLDSLTGVANRRRFDEHFAREWQRLSRDHQPLSLILLDVDYFKLYNDHYGHQQGDDCLVRLAQALDLLTYRSTDLVARYGGEEFAIVLPAADVAGAIAVAKRVQMTIQALAIPHCQSIVGDTVSVSMGIASTQPSAAEFPEALIKKADKALYQAKQRGRNQYFIGYP